MSISAPTMLSGKSGRAESAREVATTGPTTCAADIIAVSTAYAVLRKSAGTTIFHKGRIDKLIGGALNPITNASTNI